MSSSPQLKKSIQQLSRIYTSHRPAIQRSLTTAYIFYVLYSSSRAFVSKSSSSKRPSKKKNAKDAGSGPPRVAVDAVFYQRLGAILVSGLIGY
jgi:ATP-binding cassette subfamily D (ALD) long-chain fatty acid import protein